MTMTPLAAAELRSAADSLVVDYMSVVPGEEVLITTDSGGDPQAVEAIFASALACGARPTIMTLPRLPFQGGLCDPFVPATVAAAVERCSVWIDLTFPYMAGCAVHDEAMKSKRVRYLLGGDMGAGGLQRLFGDVDLDELQTAFDRFVAVLGTREGARVRVTDPLGTDVAFTLGKAAYAKPRRAVDPGTYLVPGACTMFPEIESVRGTVVTEAGFHEHFTPFASPVTIEVDGKIRSVSGGGGDRQVLERALRRAGGGDYGYVIHFTYALHPAARWTGRSFIEDSRVVGMNAVGLGLPWWVPGGGENHPDVVVGDQSIWVDNQPVIEAGQAVLPELVEASRFLRTKADAALAQATVGPAGSEPAP